VLGAALLLLTLATEAAAEVHLGRVLGVEGDTILVSVAATAAPLRLPASALPDARLAAPGTLVRVWSGDEAGEAGGLRLTPVANGAGRDLTGVRGRLSRGAGRAGAGAGSGGGRGGR
jgi:hypothetical protein